MMSHDEIPGDARCEVDAAIARLGGDVELYKELIQSFLDDHSQLLPKLKQAISTADADALHRAGHSLKGLALSCGAMGVADAAAILERYGREKRLDDLDSAWHGLSRSFAATRRVLAPYYVKDPASQPSG